MAKPSEIIDRLRIASPCSVGWENMSGDERVRFCQECNLHVYNISEMTSSEVHSLIASTEGRICARLYRRADGTVLTKDCPVGLRAVRKRVARVAGAALTTVLSLCTVALGQSRKQEDKSCAIPGIKVERVAVKDKKGTFTGVIKDEAGAVIVGATVTLINQLTEQTVMRVTNDEGQFSFGAQSAGKYTLKIDAVNFTPYEVREIEVNSDEAVIVSVGLQESEGRVTVGIVGIDQPMSENGRTTFSGDVIQKLPF